MTRTILPRTKDSSSPRTTGSPSATRPGNDVRETVEQIVVAIVLALLVRAFAAEAFVIPTGSMAPTLNGRHKEIACPQCGQVFAVNAAEEAEPVMDHRGRLVFPRVKVATCGGCRYQAEVDDAPTFKGDRILVMKFPYTLPWLPGAGGPHRWDVVVFNYPEIPEQNYIKRLVGLPDEELRIHAGDLMARPRSAPGQPAPPYRMQRKPLGHQRAMQVLVYDDTHRATAMEGKPAWLRWTSATWREVHKGTFASPEAGDGWTGLRYRHLVADPKQWEALLTHAEPAQPPRRTLITDFNPYNTGQTADGREVGDGLDPHWVGDLTLEYHLEVVSATGLIRTELVRGGVPFRCEIDVATGLARLYRADAPLGEPAATGITGPGSHDIAFANVDGRLTLWVDGRTPFGEGVVHDDGTGPRLPPTAADLDPVGIATRGASARVSGLVLKRDIYYTLTPSRGDYGNLWDLINEEVAAESRAVSVFNLLADPRRFGKLKPPEPQDYAIAPGRYMMMGDNSPRSKDGRAWTTQDRKWDKSDRASHEVPESLLIGKAFFIYWPHGKPTGPDVRLTQDFRIPFRPYFERMKWIR